LEATASASDATLAEALAQLDDRDVVGLGKHRVLLPKRTGR